MKLTRIDRMTRMEALERALEWALSMKRINSEAMRNQIARPGQESEFCMWDEMASIYREIMREIRYGDTGGE